jgi:hypothetical protein
MTAGREWRRIRRKRSNGIAKPPSRNTPMPNATSAFAMPTGREWGRIRRKRLNGIVKPPGGDTPGPNVTLPSAMTAGREWRRIRRKRSSGITKLLSRDTPTRKYTLEVREGSKAAYWNVESQTVTCPWCGQVESLEAGGDR